MHIQKLTHGDGSNLVYYSSGSNAFREESSEIIRARVVAARVVQKARNPQAVLNARLSAKELAEVGKLPAEALALLAASQRTQMLSMRGWLKIVKIARTIADLELSKNISAEHVAEALRYKFAGE
jgi:magnesium chelatase family protein